MATVLTKEYKINGSTWSTGFFIIWKLTLAENEQITFGHIVVYWHFVVIKKVKWKVTKFLRHYCDHALLFISVLSLELDINRPWFIKWLRHCTTCRNRLPTDFALLHDYMYGIFRMRNLDCYIVFHNKYFKTVRKLNVNKLTSVKHYLSFFKDFKTCRSYSKVIVCSLY